MVQHFKTSKTVVEILRDFNNLLTFGTLNTELKYAYTILKIKMHDQFITLVTGNISCF